MKEIFKDVKGYEGLYEISNLGYVKRKEKLLKSDIKRGYEYVVLCKEGKPKHKYVHRLIGEAFIDNPEKKKEINHKNGCKADNRLSNLEWVTRSENHKHAYLNGLKFPQCGEKHGNSKLTKQDVKDIRLISSSGMCTNKTLSKMFGVGEVQISRIIKRTRWSHI